MKNKELVFNIIKKSSKNLTAYEILDKLQKFKKTQPMTVYRALDSLIKEERIHKSNQTKTFMLCNHTHSKDHNTALAICKKCGDIEELKTIIDNENPLKPLSDQKLSILLSHDDVKIETDQIGVKQAQDYMDNLLKVKV